MGVDYYNILEISRSASPHEIRKAYARVSVRERPERTHACDGTPLSPEQRARRRTWFRLAGEAYDVLSRPLLRAAFDQFGEEGLKNGVPARDPDLFLKPYTYHGDPIKTYREFFGTESGSGPVLLCWQKQFEDEEVRRPDGSEGPWFRERPLEVPLSLSLEQVARGGPAEAVLVRREVAGGVLEDREHVLRVELPPGVLPGTAFHFPQQGHQAPHSVPADVAVVTRDAPHAVFAREGGADLVAVFRISLEEALLGCALQLPSLDGRTLRVRVTDVVAPGYELRVTGEGLPICLTPPPSALEDPARSCYAAPPPCPPSCCGPQSEPCMGCAFVTDLPRDPRQDGDEDENRPDAHSKSPDSETNHPDSGTLGKSPDSGTVDPDSETKEFDGTEGQDVDTADPGFGTEHSELGTMDPDSGTESGTEEEEGGPRGDLVLRFVVEYPRSVPAPRRGELRRALRGLTPTIPPTRTCVTPLPREP